MSNIHEQLSQINIKPQSVNPEVLRNVYKFAAEHQPKKTPAVSFKRAAMLMAAAAVAVVALAIFALPNSSRDLTLAGISYYTVDINPSITIKTDSSKNVIGIEGLNEDGQELIAQIECDGKPINDALEEVLKAARQMGYLDGKNVVIGYFGSGDSGVLMDKVAEMAGTGKAVMLIGSKNQYDEFLSSGLQPGLELLELEGEKLGLDESSPYSDIVAALIESNLPTPEKPTATSPATESPSPEESTAPSQSAPTEGITPSPTPEETPSPKPTVKPTATSAQLSSTISGHVSDSGIALSWTKITDPAFNGYKVVASKTNPNPKYPDDGYIYYYTDSSKTSTVIPFSKLQANTNYYFSITVLYEGANKAGNAVMLKTPEQTILYESTTLSGYADAGGIHLSWSKVNSEWADGYKVVASTTDSTPSYPENGYVEWITNLSDTGRSYCPGCTFQAGQSYWIAITVVYSDGTKITSNVLNLTIPAPATPSPSPSPSPTPTESPTPSPSPSPSPSPEPTASPSPSSTAEGEATPSPTPEPTPSAG